MSADPGTLSAVTAELVRKQQVANARQVAMVQVLSLLSLPRKAVVLTTVAALLAELPVRGKAEPIRTFIPSRRDEGG